MKRRTSILKGTIISIGLLAGGSAVAMPMAGNGWNDLHYNFHGSGGARGMRDVHSNETNQGSSVVSVADIGRFSKADIASAIAVFYTVISGNRKSEAPTMQVPVSINPVDRISIGESASASKPATSVPEPASLALLGLGLAGIGFTKRTRRNDKK